MRWAACAQVAKRPAGRAAPASLSELAEANGHRASTWVRVVNGGLSPETDSVARRDFARCRAGSPPPTRPGGGTADPRTECRAPALAHAAGRRFEVSAP